MVRNTDDTQSQSRAEKGDWFDERTEANEIAKFTKFDDIHDAARRSFKKLREFYESSVCRLLEDLEMVKRSWIKTSEKLPTKDDADSLWNVFAVEHGALYPRIVEYRDVQSNYAYWMPIPALPVQDANQTPTDSRENP